MRTFFFPFITSVSLKKRGIILFQKNPISFKENIFFKSFVHIKAGLHILVSSWIEERSYSGSEQEIIDHIHTHRFDPKNGYLITGGHFADLYVRNMGIFYNALLDPRIPSSEEDWQNRQQIYLQTVAFALEAFAQAKKTYTTIVPLFGMYVTTRNVYTTPSDSLFGIVYALNALFSKDFIPSLWPSAHRNQQSLQTQTAAKKLLQQYKNALEKLLKSYLLDVLDTKTHLVRKDIHLASAADGIKRQSSFYDNVIAWATCWLASRLSLQSFSKKDMDMWKENILTGFWDKEKGVFLNDLSGENVYFSDWLIVVSTQFLSVSNKQERQMLERIISFIEKNNIDKPFPLPYSQKNNLKDYYLPVTIAAPDYMGKAIWSHWGIEYIKLLILLSKYNKNYLAKAQQYLTFYTKNITSSGGYPEIYNQKGKIYKKPFYKAVLQNGWIINYEQAKLLLSQK